MTRQHGQTTYYIEGEGFVGDEQVQALGLTRGGEPEPQQHEAERAFRFSRMFDLPKLDAEIDGLIALGHAMDDTTNLKDHATLTAGFTYFGQFLDHDITFDKTAGLPDTELSVEEIVQGRSPSLDLDSVYGRGPGLEEKPLYEDDNIHLRVGTTSPLFGSPGPEGLALPNDLPRGHNAANRQEATIGDPRNDENLAVAQTHLAFLKFHNVVADMLAESGLSGDMLFERARRSVTLHYQWIVLHDFLPRVIEPEVLNAVLTGGRQFFQFTPGEEPAMPIEFSVAAYRFGHSMIRDDYTWNRNFPNAGLDLLFAFSAVSGTLFGFDTVPSNWPVDWRRLYDFSGVPGVDAPPAMNLTRSIDTALAINLRTLPAHAAEGDKASLAVRNLLRGRLVGLPSGQTVAEAIGAPVMTPEQVRQGPHSTILRDHGLDAQTPLWYYILKEAEVFHNGQRLGPVGSRIMAETFVGLIEGSRNSVLAPSNRYWRPSLPAQRPGTFTMVDLLLLVNDLNPLGAEFGELPPPPPVERIHVVQPGDTLRSLAMRFLGNERRWREIFDLNRDTLENPDKIRVGQELRIP